ncbi:hypothetical protein ACIA6C_13315 [Streptomyces sp. NPDC051578]|uniref:hypothetical protein n=1 Tax=Streptomyces sp. NPDC051578 TaxID=3365662 RepID=UPI0037B70C50
MIKRLGIHAQVLGRTVLFTLCGPAHRDARRDVAQALGDLPTGVMSIILDVDHGPRRGGDRLVRLVGDYARSRGLYLVTIGPAVSAPRSTVPAGRVAGRAGTAEDGLSRALFARALCGQASGVRAARKGDHPCGR